MIMSLARVDEAWQSRPMQVKLYPHPDSVAGIDGIDVEIIREGDGGIALTYRIFAPGAALRLPPDGGPRRADELWRHTCCELFVQGAGGYFEFNFSPSRAWAAYGFSGYREGMRVVGEIAAPEIETSLAEDHVELRIRLALPAVLQAEFSRVGLCAVIETVEGMISYWALRHPPGKPDFHHPSSFALDLLGASIA